MRSMACCLLLIAFPACFTDRGRPAPPIVTTSQIKGRVLGPDGALLPAAVVELSVPSEAGDAWRKIADTQTNSDGSYMLSTRHVGAHRIAARAERCVEAAAEFTLLKDVKEQLCEFSLAASEQTTIDGILLTPDGLPLSDIDIAFLFPALASHDETIATRGEDGVAEYFPFTGGSGLFARYEHGGESPDGPLAAAIDERSARFRIDVPAWFDGRIALDFRGDEKISSGWKTGDGVVEYEVDVAALRATLGSIEISTGQPTHWKSFAILRDDADPSTSSFLLSEVDTPLRLIGVPAGRYSVVGIDSDGAPEAMVVTVEPAQKKAITLAPGAPARIEVAVTDARYTAFPLAPEQIEIRTPRGAPLPFQVSIDARPNRTASVVIERVPAGSAVLFVAGSFVVLDLVAGETHRIEMKLENPATVDIDAQAFASWIGNVPPTMPVKMRLTTLEDVLVMDSRFDVPFVKDGWVSTTLTAPPGKYRLVLDLGGYRTIDETIDHTGTAGITLLYPFEP